MIRLIGPGGAGKSTIGALLAERLGVPFVDLVSRVRDSLTISRYAGENLVGGFVPDKRVVRQNQIAGPG